MIKIHLDWKSLKNGVCKSMVYELPVKTFTPRQEDIIEKLLYPHALSLLGTIQ